MQLFTRNYKEFEEFVTAGHEVDSVTLITEGSAHMMSVEGFFIMILPSKSVFGDFNCAFNTKTLVSLRGQERPDGVIDVPGRDIFTCTTMNCPKDVFEDLMDLYPDTAENIKIRSLEKREVVMYYLQKERCRQIKKLGEKITKQDQIMFDKWIP